MLDLKRVLASKPRKPKDATLASLTTVWGEGLDPAHVLEEHPHPQFARDAYATLNGHWDYAFVADEDAATSWRTATAPATWDGQILVPFSPEAPLSGVARQLQPSELLWYHLAFYPSARLGLGEDDLRDKRVILHFEAVDHACACFVNDTLMGTHEGGYLPFSYDVTDVLHAGQNDLLLCVFDPSEKGTQPRGKQMLARRDIWYTAQSGIWQSVWLEAIPVAHIEDVRLLPDADAGQLTVEAHLSKPGSTLQVIVTGDGQRWEASCVADEVICCVGVTIDDPHLWSPDDPYLYDLELRYVEDVVHSYVAFRTVTVEPDEAGTLRFMLNHRPLFLRGVLDQGYWPDGLMTAPSDAALLHDIQAARSLGFNMLRKHIKVERDRWYYHCDQLGMLVWQDAVSGGGTYDLWATSYRPTLFSRSWRNTRDDTDRAHRSLSSGDEGYRRLWMETCLQTVRYLGNHPCIVTWVPFNEGWGQFDARDVTARLAEVDPTRPIDATSGWYDQGAGDYLSEHNYFRPIAMPRGTKGDGRACVLSEFGGLSFWVAGHSSLEDAYGYATYDSPAAWWAAVQDVMAQAAALEAEGLCGFVYTQLSDIEEEVNGLLTYDRCVNKAQLAGESQR